MKKKALSLVLSLALCLSLIVPVMGADAPSYQVLLVSDITGQGYSAYQDCATAYVDQNGGCRLLRYTGDGIEFVTESVYQKATEIYPGGYFTHNYNQLIDINGNVVIPRGQYDYVSGIDETYALGQKDQESGPRALYLINLKDGSVIPFAPGITSYSDGLFLGWEKTESSTRSYYMDLAGNRVITLREGYQADPFSGGYASVKILVDNYYYGYEIIDKSGQVVLDLPLRHAVLGDWPEELLPKEYTIEGKISEGLVLAREIKFHEHGIEPNRLGYIDMEGNIAVPCEYEINSAEFRNGYAVVEKIEETDSTKRQVGLVDRNGNVVIPVGEYKNLSNVSETGLLWATGYDGKICVLRVTAGSGAQPEQPTGPVAPPVSATALPTNDTLTLNGVAQNPTVFKLDGGDNYFKIRDLAAMLNGTEKQFAVGYDGSVQVTTGQPYEAVGGELAGAAEGSFTAEPTNDAIYIDGVKADLTAYKIEGNNFFRLRDLGRALDFYVGWTAERGVFIETDKPYAD